ncbi:hypothetical protein N7331_04255 [Aeromonas caviae]|uniref:hypothetical protein n=1 Tax=Aeromonas caviae TaxID=648 RepID=UPI00244957D4|nr:hypothetical protein [Aeromonas caviae]MDH0137590.1 hypothetical protein [Aeromonas caviae]
MNSTKFNAAQQAEGLVLSVFWGESLRRDHLRLYRLQSRLATLRIRRRVRGIRDRAQTRALLHMCKLARTTLHQSHTLATAHARALRASVGGQA